jgi:uncharacterized membrane protein YciS (DUF1049 family)
MKRRKFFFSEFASGFFAIAVLVAILFNGGMEIPTGWIFVLAGCAIILAVFSLANRRKRKELETQKAAIENAKKIIEEEPGSLEARDKYYWR